MTSNLPEPQNNSLLASLTEEVQQRIIPHLELVTLALGQVIYESGDILQHVLFPTDSIISMLYVMENGASAEISVIGNDGIVGLALLMGGDSMPSRAIVQSAGQAYKIKAHLIKEEFYHHGELEKLVLRFSQCLFTQMSQTAACNRHHSIDQQLCRWILLSLDRLPTNQLNMTHGLIANMLGVRREGVTEAAGKLQHKGVIEYSRGSITVLDRPRLEELSCECYAAVKRETDRLLTYSRPRLTLFDEITAASSSIELRQNAEAQLKRTTFTSSKENAKKLLHELQVYQIELEMQNEELQRSRKAEVKLVRAASVFTHADEGIMIADASGSITEVNDAFSRITGYAAVNVVGKNPRFLQSGRHPPEFYVEMWAAIVAQGYWRGEIWNRRKNGEFYAEMITISAVKNTAGAVQHYVSLSTDITSMKTYQRQLERRAHYDVLTDLPNRVLLADRLNQAMLNTHRRNRLLAVVFMDLDGFKSVNDAHGHVVGDELLIAVSLRMNEALREGDTLARIGGDEFIAVMVDLEDIEDSEIVLERLLKAAADPVTVGDAVLQVSVSIGVTTYPQVQR